MSILIENREFIQQVLNIDPDSRLENAAMVSTYPKIQEMLRQLLEEV